MPVLSIKTLQPLPRLPAAANLPDGLDWQSPGAFFHAAFEGRHGIGRPSPV
jgi:hypothetical protein